MSVTGSGLYAAICARGSIHGADIAALRDLFYADDAIAVADADALFVINRTCCVQDASWQPFFVAAVADFIVGNAEPRGYINTENADWLLERISCEGRLETPTALEILIGAMAEARWSPESLVCHALNAVKDAILCGDGTLRYGKRFAPGVVTEGDVELLRRIILAYDGDGNSALSRAEAEILVEINDATADKTDNPAWTELFVKALSGMAMASSGLQAPSRQEALQREQWQQTRGDFGPADLVRQMFKIGLSGWFDHFVEQSPEQRELARLDRERREIIVNEVVRDDEAAWLVGQINRVGALTYNEQCLLENLKGERSKLLPGFTEMIDRVAVSA